jgi:hypothetical protein
MKKIKNNKNNNPIIFYYKYSYTNIILLYPISILNLNASKISHSMFSFLGKFWHCGNTKKCRVSNRKFFFGGGNDPSRHILRGKSLNLPYYNNLILYHNQFLIISFM